MLPPNPRDFFTPRAEFEIADVIIMHRHLLFLEPTAVPIIASSIISGAPALLPDISSLHAMKAADLINAQWLDPLAPKFHVPTPGSFSEKDFNRVRRVAAGGKGAALDFVYFTGTHGHPFPRHAACALYLDTDVCGTSRITSGPALPFAPFIWHGAWSEHCGIGTTTKKVGPRDYDSHTDYLFSTDAVRGDHSVHYLPADDWTGPDDPALHVRSITMNMSTHHMTGTPPDDKAWAMPYVEPGKDLMLDMDWPEGITSTTRLCRR